MQHNAAPTSSIPPDCETRPPHLVLQLHPKIKYIYGFLTGAVKSPPETPAEGPLSLGFLDGQERREFPSKQSLLGLERFLSLS